MTKTCRYEECKGSACEGSSYCRDHLKEASKSKSKTSSLQKIASENRIGQRMADSFLDELEKISAVSGPLTKTAAITRVGKSPLFSHDMTERGITSSSPLSTEAKKSFIQKAEARHGRKHADLEEQD